MPRRLQADTHPCVFVAIFELASRFLELSTLGGKFSSAQRSGPECGRRPPEAVAGLRPRPRTRPFPFQRFSELLLGSSHPHPNPPFLPHLRPHPRALALPSLLSRLLCARPAQALCPPPWAVQGPPAGALHSVRAGTLPGSVSSWKWHPQAGGVCNFASCSEQCPLCLSESQGISRPKEGTTHQPWAVE